MEKLIIDPDKYDLFAIMIQKYCKKQQEVFHDYILKLQSLSQMWDDENTYGEVLEEVRVLEEKFRKEMETIGYYYYRHFKERATEIRNRP